MISAEKRKNSLGGSSISTPMNKRQKDLLTLDNKKQSDILRKYQIIAKSKGGKCLSEEYINSNNKLEFECVKGHRWKTIPYKVRHGSWCPVCKRDKKRKYYFDIVKHIAESKGGKCLSKKYINGPTKLKWECKEGHTWFATPSNIKQGTWCPEHIGRKKGSIAEMQKIAESKGGKCLSEKYINCNIKLEFECKKGHRWLTTPDNIRHGSWCPQCRKKRMNELKIKWKEEIKKLKMKADGTWENEKKRIEIQAKKNKSRFKKMQKLVKSKGGKCLSEKFIYVSKKLKWECKEGHKWMTKPYNILHGNWCPECTRIKMRKIKFEEMQKLAKENGGKCLSKKYINGPTKLEWECKEGHKWKDTLCKIRHGSWCPECTSKGNPPTYIKRI